MIRDIEKCIHIINTYGSQSEKTVADELRSLTWNHNPDRCAHLTLNNIVGEYMLKTANEIIGRIGKTNEWFTEDDELYVYQMDDCEWWLSHLSIKETRDIFIKEYGLSEEDVDIEEIRECDLEKDGMFWRFDEQPEIEILIQALLKGEVSQRIKFKGKDICQLDVDGVEIWVPFKRAIELSGGYEKPYMIATTER